MLFCFAGGAQGILILMVRYSQDSVAAVKSPPIFPHRLLQLKVFQKMKAKLLKETWQCMLVVQCETKCRGFIACIVSIEELGSWRCLPESEVAGIVVCITTKHVKWGWNDAQLVMPLAVVLLSKTSNAVMALLYGKDVTSHCQTTTKHIAASVAKQWGFEIVGVFCTAHAKLLHNRCTFHVEKLPHAEFPCL